MAGYDTWHSGNVTVWFKVFFEPQNVKQGLPAFGGARGDQGISNVELKISSFCGSLFDIRYYIFRALIPDSPIHPVLSVGKDRFR